VDAAAPALFTEAYRYILLPPMSDTLKGRIALVAGASRGCGRGIAVALGEQGATVYVTGRSIRGGPPPVDEAEGTIEDTAEEVTRRGGVGIPLQVDHTDARQSSDAFRRVKAEQGCLDILACAVWGGNERFVDPIWKQPYWELPVEFWNDFMGAGPQSFWIAACEATRLMARRGHGLIVGISEPIIEPARLSGNL
jgi:NAD(P)-dependent dehydrogenase (short-subunit alcohol dehydrogenase family)